MNSFELYDSVRALTDLSAIDDIEMACRFAKMAILREKIENAIKEAHAYGFNVTIDHENEDGVKEVIITAGTSIDNWGVIVR